MIKLFKKPVSSEEAKMILEEVYNCLIDMYPETMTTFELLLLRKLAEVPEDFPRIGAEGLILNPKNDLGPSAYPT